MIVVNPLGSSAFWSNLSVWEPRLRNRNKEGITYFKNNINQQLRRDGKNTQKNYTKKKKKDLNDPDNHME